MKKFSAIFSLVMGIIMAAVWVALISTGQHDFTQETCEKISLVAAESLTSILLISGGLGTLYRKAWGIYVHLASYGMMVYTAVFSIGVFAQAKNTPAAIFFVVLSITSLIILWGWASGRFEKVS